MKKSTYCGSISKEIARNGMTLIITRAGRQMKLLRYYTNAKAWGFLNFLTSRRTDEQRPNKENRKKASYAGEK